MLCTTLRSVLRPVITSLRPSLARRLASTSTRERSRTWRSAAVRLGLSFGILLYLNASPVFADAASQPAPTLALPGDDRPAVDSISQKRKQSQAKLTISAPKYGKQTEAHESRTNAQSALAADNRKALDEEDASQQAAFDPETGEFNWDCSCLGGMAHGPCGEEFKAAFSCFMLSTVEPRGIECIGKFQDMQACFRNYPNVYGAELADDDEVSTVPSHGDRQLQAKSKNRSITTHKIASSKHSTVVGEADKTQNLDAPGMKISAGKSQ
ncbi:hypothetical protein FOBRF1_014753 [Fusarium oxysporum]